MNHIEEEIVYEEKVDKITEYLEELILNAILSVLKNIKERDEFYCVLKDQTDRNDSCF